ncbi:MAG: hypothetical protein J5I98_07295, partial [Phaeodactylibacter sp.]|nr:hypothetical protein [Phaeodactylibacter sp.]
GFGYPKIVKEHMGYNTLNPAFETRFQALGECKKQCKSRIAIGKTGAHHTSHVINQTRPLFFPKKALYCCIIPTANSVTPGGIV